MTDYTEEQETVIDEIKPFTLDELQSELAELLEELKKADMVLTDRIAKTDCKRMEVEQEDAKNKELAEKCDTMRAKAKSSQRFIATLLAEREAAKSEAEKEYAERDELYALQLGEVHEELEQLAAEDGGTHAARAARIAKVLEIELSTQPCGLAPTGT